MINREIPFRPRLEGDFRVRFYDAASSITEHTPLSKIERIIEEEINWVTNSCKSSGLRPSYQRLHDDKRLLR